MLRWTVVAALLLTLALGAAVVLIGPGSATRPAVVGLDFRRADVVELRVERPGSPAERIVPAGEPGDWRLVIGDESEALGWPVGPSHVRSALRHLSMLSVQPDDTGEPEPPADAAAVIVRLRDGSERTLRLDDRALGGRVAAWLETPAGRAHGWAEAALRQALVDDGPRAWREDSALPLAGPDASRITLQSDEGRLSLGRVLGRWALREPVAAPADEAAVGRLVAALANVRIVDFGDGEALREPESASRWVALEADRRLPGAEAPRTERNELHLGAAADLAGTRQHAKVARTGPDGGSLSRAVIVRGESLASISTDPASYIARTAIPSPAADVGRLELRHDAGPPIVFARTLDGWGESRPDGTVVPATAGDAKGVVALLTLLTSTPASGVALDAPADASVLGMVVLGDLAGEPVAEAELRQTADGNGALLVRIGPVWRTYRAEAASPAVAWLATILASSSANGG